MEENKRKKRSGNEIFLPLSFFVIWVTRLLLIFKSGVRSKWY